MYIVVAYDIENTKRRNKVHKILKNYGSHVQYSIFECVINQEQLNNMRNQILKYIDKDFDSVIFYNICKSCADNIERIGLDKKIDYDYLIF